MNNFLQLHKRRFVLFMFAILVFGIAHVVAYEARAKKMPDNVRVLTSRITEPVEKEGALYYPLNYRNLIDLLWRYEVFDIEDVKALNQYIRLSHCHLYGTYVKNDFAWSRLVESKKRELQYFQNGVNERFALSDVIELSRFDFEHNLFYLDSRSIMQNMGVINLFYKFNIDYGSCANRYENSFSEMPDIMSLKLENPVTIRSFPMDPKGARRLIRRFELQNNGQRILFSRLYIRFNGIADKKLIGSYKDFVQFKGRLERFEIYSDIEYTDLLYVKDFR